MIEPEKSVPGDNQSWFQIHFYRFSDNHLGHFDLPSLDSSSHCTSEDNVYLLQALDIAFAL